MLEELILPNWILPVFKPAFARLMKRVKPHTMVSRKKMQNLWRLLQRVERDRVEGDFVELGVARGGTAVLIAVVARGSRCTRQVWMYDAFEELQEPCAFYRDVYQLMFSEFGFDPGSVNLIKGFFGNVVNTRTPRPISFMHIDVSGYVPVKECLCPLFPVVVSHGWVVFDNYGVDKGCRKAVDEFLAEHNLSDRLHRFGRSQAFFQKP